MWQRTCTVVRFLQKRARHYAMVSPFQQLRSGSRGRISNSVLSTLMYVYFPSSFNLVCLRDRPNPHEILTPFSQGTAFAFFKSRHTRPDQILEPLGRAYLRPSQRYVRCALRTAKLGTLTILVRDSYSLHEFCTEFHHRLLRSDYPRGTPISKCHHCAEIRDRSGLSRREPPAFIHNRRMSTWLW